MKRALAGKVLQSVVSVRRSVSTPSLNQLTFDLDCYAASHAKMRPLATVLAWSDCPLDTTVSPTKMDEPIKMPFRNHILGRGPDPPGDTGETRSASTKATLRGCGGQ